MAGIFLLNLCALVPLRESAFQKILSLRRRGAEEELPRVLFINSFLSLRLRSSAGVSFGPFPFLG